MCEPAKNRPFLLPQDKFTPFLVCHPINGSARCLPALPKHPELQRHSIALEKGWKLVRLLGCHNYMMPSQSWSWQTPVSTAESFDLRMNTNCNAPTEDQSQMLVGVNGSFTQSKIITLTKTLVFSVYLPAKVAPQLMSSTWVMSVKEILHHIWFHMDCTDSNGKKLLSLSK